MLLILLFFYSFTIGYQFLQLLGCSFSQAFAFNKDIYLFHLQHFFHTDAGLHPVLIRAFHNKLTILIPDVLNAYLHYWDLLFIISFLGILSTVGFAYACWHVITEPCRRNTILGIIVLTLPLVIVLVSGFLPSVFWLLSLRVVWQIFAFVGLWQLAQIHNKKITFSLMVVCLLTLLWTIVFSHKCMSFA